MSDGTTDLLSAEQLLKESTAKLAKTIRELEEFRSASESLQEANRTNTELARSNLESSKALQNVIMELGQEGVVRFGDQLQEGLRKIRTTNTVLIAVLVLLVSVVGVEVYLNWLTG